MPNCKSGDLVMFFKLGDLPNPNNSTFGHIPLHEPGDICQTCGRAMWHWKPNSALLLEDDRVHPVGELIWSHDEDLHPIRDKPQEQNVERETEVHGSLARD